MSRRYRQAKSNGEAWSVPLYRLFGGRTQPIALAIALAALTEPSAFRYDSFTFAPSDVPVRPTGIHFSMFALMKASV